MTDNIIRILSIDESFKAVADEFVDVNILINRIAKNIEESLADIDITLAEFDYRLSVLEKKGKKGE